MVREDEISGRPIVQYIDFEFAYRINGQVSYADRPLTEMGSDYYWPQEKMADREKDVDPDFNQDIFSFGSMIKEIHVYLKNNIAFFKDFAKAAQDSDPAKRPSLDSFIEFMRALLKVNNIYYPEVPEQKEISSTARLMQAGIAVVESPTDNTLINKSDYPGLLQSPKSIFTPRTPARKERLPESEPTLCGKMCSIM